MKIRFHANYVHFKFENLCHFTIFNYHQKIMIFCIYRIYGEINTIPPI